MTPTGTSTGATSGERTSELPSAALGVVVICGALAGLAFLDFVVHVSYANANKPENEPSLIWVVLASVAAIGCIAVVGYGLALVWRPLKTIVPRVVVHWLLRICLLASIGGGTWTLFQIIASMVSRSPKYIYRIQFVELWSQLIVMTAAAGLFLFLLTRREVKPT